MEITIGLLIMVLVLTFLGGAVVMGLILTLVYQNLIDKWQNLALKKNKRGLKMKNYELIIENRGIYTIKAENQIQAVIKAEDKGILNSEIERFSLKEVKD